MRNNFVVSLKLLKKSVIYLEMVNEARLAKVDFFFAALCTLTNETFHGKETFEFTMSSIILLL